jgi:hypothetical protein
MSTPLRAGGEVPVGNVDGDALLAFGAKAVGEEREIEDASTSCSFAFDGMKLVLVDALSVVEQTADERGLAIVDRARGGEAKKVAGVLFRKKTREGEVG